MPLIAAAVALLWIMARLLIRDSKRARAKGLRQLLRKEDGAAEAVDFVLVLPLLLLVCLLFIQVLMAAHASLIVHYAAYAAARAARTAYFEMPVEDVMILQGLRRMFEEDESLMQRGYLWRLIEDNEVAAHDRATTAAQLALMSAVPAAQRPPVGVPSDSAGAAVIDMLRPFHGRRPVVAGSKADYSFDPFNSAVAVGVVDDFENEALLGDTGDLRIDALPVYARVVFRYPLLLPVGRFFGERDDSGHYTRVLSAQVELL